MIFHTAFYRLNPDVNHAAIEDMVRTTRSLLLKIPEVLGVKSGRNLDTGSEWQFFFSIETDSLDKLQITLEDPFYLKFLEMVTKPHTSESFAMNFELDPSKDLKYS